MKRLLALITAIMLFTALLPFTKAAASEDVILQTAGGRGGEYVTDFSFGWRFGGRDAGAETVSKEGFDDTGWEKVDIPHTWNIKDGENGGNNYDRCAYWYRKSLDVTKTEGKRIYIEFLGANTKTDVYVNGKRASLPDGTFTHRGGYTAFRYDITALVRKGENTIAVKVDNRRDEAIAPISGDFNMYGGIYRKVNIITVNEVHIDLENYGSSGLFVTTNDVRSKERPSSLGKMNVKADIVNDSDRERRIVVETKIIGDNAPKAVKETITIPAGGRYAFKKDMKVENPHLWNGISYEKDADNSDVGYQYKIEVSLFEDSQCIDKVTEKIGFRYFWVDKDKGFYLNGEYHPLRGVNRHQYKIGMGSALTEKEHEEDMALIKDLGANMIRLCHYPQTDYFYDLCDENGMIVWTEIPFVNQLGSSEEFDEVTKEQLKELMRQQYNRPSVCFWGLQNEVGNGTPTNSYMNMKQLMNELDLLAKKEDASGRYTVQAVNQNYSMNQNRDEGAYSDYTNNTGWKSDLISWNIYPGWYGNFSGSFYDVMTSKKVLDSRPMGISEYGWGSNINQHELYPELNKNGLTPYGAWHPEEYQNMMHEEAVRYINDNDYLWSTLIWAMFDFSVDSRNEGGQPGVNDKGLVTNDRKIKKDSFYLYQANWRKDKAVLHITSKRMAKRDTAISYVKIYSNCDEVELFKNDISLGMMENKGDGIFVMEKVKLEVGENSIVAKGRFDGENYTDSCVWTRERSNLAQLESDSITIDNTKKTVILDKDYTLKEFEEKLFGVNGAKWTLFDKNDAVTDKEKAIVAGMSIKVVAEDSVTEAIYYITTANLAFGKNVISSSNEKGNEAYRAVDSDPETRWVAVNNTYPQNITIDMGEEYFLGSGETDWYDDKNRYYSYDIEVSCDGENYVKVADRTDNTQVGYIKDNLQMTKGRYVRINIYKCSNSAGYAALYEVKINGWRMESDLYEINHGNRIITADKLGDAEGVTPDRFFDNLKIYGNCTYELKVGTGYVNDSDRLVITDYEGREIVYIVSLPLTVGDKKNNTALFKKVYASTEEGRGTDGKDTHAYSAVDGDLQTRWAAETNGGTSAKYPEWIGVDLGQSYKISDITIHFETKADRVYSYQVFGSKNTPLKNGEEIPESYVMISDESDNRNGGKNTVDCNGEEYRYIAVKVLGCDKWGDNARYISASIYEIEINSSIADENLLLIQYDEKENLLTTGKKGTLVICNYENDTLKEVGVHSVEALQSITPCVEITDKTKIYLWDGFKGIKPISLEWEKG